MSDALPTFETGRLLIRPRTMTDYEACLAMDRDPLALSLSMGLGTMLKRMSGF
ncbi:hypothetical protein LJR029_002418 [Caballeronia sp. LjRoot29]|uniref:hypothetical protein n=1 Tax=Caballeronia sp. LjRoot29 TaxID=3342315 RepID=UPI003ECE77E5